MFARCSSCRRFNLVFECINQMIDCKECGTRVFTGIDNLVSEQQKKRILLDEILEFKKQLASESKY